MVSTATQCRSRNDTGMVAEGVFTLVLVCTDTRICIFLFHSISEMLWRRELIVQRVKETHAVSSAHSMLS